MARFSIDSRDVHRHTLGPVIGGHWGFLPNLGNGLVGAGWRYSLARQCVDCGRLVGASLTITCAWLDQTVPGPGRDRVLDHAESTIEHNLEQAVLESGSAILQ